MSTDPTPRIDQTPFAPIEPPSILTLAWCPACGRQITGGYNLEPARKRCTKTWHIAMAITRDYVATEAAA